MKPKERRKYRERVRPILARHDLQPIYEMNFRSSYYVLDTIPPSGNIRMSKMFLMKLHQRGVELASACKSTFGGMSVYFRQKIMGVDTDDGNWHSLKNGLTYELEVDYWDAYDLKDIEEDVSVIDRVCLVTFCDLWSEHMKEHYPAILPAIKSPRVDVASNRLHSQVQ